MEGLLKKNKLIIDRRTPFNCPESGTWVQITEKEHHPIWGPRYKVKGYVAWFHEDCFEEIKL